MGLVIILFITLLSSASSLFCYFFCQSPVFLLYFNTVAQSRILATWFEGRELAFALQFLLCMSGRLVGTIPGDHIITSKDIAIIIKNTKEDKKEHIPCFEHLPYTWLMTEYKLCRSFICQTALETIPILKPSCIVPRSCKTYFELSHNEFACFSQFFQDSVSTVLIYHVADIECILVNIYLPFPGSF